MRLNEISRMFEHLSKYKKILLTGPHRSESTFAATAIQYDLKDTHSLVLEERCWLPKLDLSRLDYWLTECSEPVVVQAPFAADVCHQYPGIFVVFMHRAIKDIEASQKRMYTSKGDTVNWPHIEMTERAKYGSEDYSLRISEVKYESWQAQKERIGEGYYLELQTDTLVDHPLYVPKEIRKDFHVRQTSAVG